MKCWLGACRVHAAVVCTGPERACGERSPAGAGRHCQYHSLPRMQALPLPQHTAAGGRCTRRGGASCWGRQAEGAERLYRCRRSMLARRASEGAHSVGPAPLPVLPRSSPSEAGTRTRPWALPEGSEVSADTRLDLPPHWAQSGVSCRARASMRLVAWPAARLALQHASRLIHCRAASRGRADLDAAGGRSGWRRAAITGGGSAGWRGRRRCVAWRLALPEPVHRQTVVPAGLLLLQAHSWAGAACAVARRWRGAPVVVVAADGAGRAADLRR